MQFRQRKAFRALLKYKNSHTLSQGGLDIGLKVGILAEIGYMLQECAVVLGSFSLIRHSHCLSHFPL